MTHCAVRVIHLKQLLAPLHQQHIFRKQAQRLLKISSGTAFT